MNTIDNENNNERTTSTTTVSEKEISPPIVTNVTKNVTKKPVEKNQTSFIVEIFRFAVLALIIVIPFRMFIAQPFIVSGASMSPTFETGQYLIVDQISYRLEPPARGDVIIFRYPEDTTKFFIKRVIGLPNETVEIKGKTVIIHDPKTSHATTLTEPYLHDFNTRDDFMTVTLGPDQYFVMGDNRGASSDSRIWGAVPAKLIVGRAFVRLMPVNQISVFPGAYPLANEEVK